VNVVGDVAIVLARPNKKPPRRSVSRERLIDHFMRLNRRIRLRNNILSPIEPFLVTVVGYDGAILPSLLKHRELSPRFIPVNTGSADSLRGCVSDLHDSFLHSFSNKQLLWRSPLFAYETVPSN